MVLCCAACCVQGLGPEVLARPLRVRSLPALSSAADEEQLSDGEGDVPSGVDVKSDTAIAWGAKLTKGVGHVSGG